MLNFLALCYLTTSSKDIEACQKKHKTILLSIGGATYSEGGFKSEADAKDGAKLMWETFGPKQPGSKALRPFGDAALDGFDLDFEAHVEHMAPFANELRSLMEADKSSQQFYLTAAPQCPYPDEADKEILNGPVYIDAIWVQFYNNFCGVNSFNTDKSASKYNFDEWDNWAKTVSKNKDVKVMIGVPAFTTAASTGYIPASKLDEVIQYSKKFTSFGGVMMWDATQAYGNEGFIQDVRKSLGPADDDSGSSPDPASTSASASTSTDSTKTNTSTSTKTSSTTTQSSNAPDSSPSSSSSSSASASPKAPETTTTTEAEPTTSVSENSPDDPATQAKPTTTSTTTAAPKPSTTESQQPNIATTATSSEATATPTETADPPNNDYFSDGDWDNDWDDDEDEDNKTNSSKNKSDKANVGSMLGNDLLSLLGGLRQANNVVNGAKHGPKVLRRGQRNGV